MPKSSLRQFGIIQLNFALLLALSEGGSFVVVNWIWLFLVKCENIGLHKMIGSGSWGGKLAIRANLLVRQSLPNLSHQWPLANQLCWWRGEGALRDLGGATGALRDPSGSSMGSLGSPAMAGRLGRGWTMERARRLADGRQRPPKVYSSYSFQG